MLLIPCCFNYIPIRKAFVKKKKEFGVTSTLYTFLLNERLGAFLTGLFNSKGL